MLSSRNILLLLLVFDMYSLVVPSIKRFVNHKMRDCCETNKGNSGQYSPDFIRGMIHLKGSLLARKGSSCCNKATKPSSTTVPPAKCTTPKTTTRKPITNTTTTTTTTTQRPSNCENGNNDNSTTVSEFDTIIIVAPDPESAESTEPPPESTSMFIPMPIINCLKKRNNGRNVKDVSTKRKISYRTARLSTNKQPYVYDEQSVRQLLPPVNCQESSVDNVNTASRRLAVAYVDEDDGDIDDTLDNDLIVDENAAFADTIFNQFMGRTRAVKPSSEIQRTLRKQSVNDDYQNANSNSMRKNIVDPTALLKYRKRAKIGQINDYREERRRQQDADRDYMNAPDQSNDRTNNGDYRWLRFAND